LNIPLFSLISFHCTSTYFYTSLPTMRRGVSDDRATKQALIQKLAAAKKQQDNGSRPNRPIIGLSDSSDEDDYASSDPDNAEYNSDLDHEDAMPSSTAPPVLSAPSFNRLRKQDSTQFSRSGSNVTSTSATTDSLVNGMQGLSVAGGNSGSKSNVTKNFTRQPSAASQSSSMIPTTNTTAVTDTSEEENEEEDVDIVDESTCLVLKDSAHPSTQQFRLSPKLSSTLYPHQIEGVTWLYGLWKVGAGGILADDMGLGKTMQTSAFLAGLLNNRLASRALILAPTTLIATWEKELKACGLGDLTHQYYGTPTERERALKRVVGPNKRGVVLTTYGMVLHNAELLAQNAQHDPDDGPLWDLIIMDEGHKLKNPKMQLRKRLEMLPVRQRIILSGTPIQNNLMEMHALFDLVCPGLLGDSKAFKDHYEKRITAGNDKHATIGERERGAATAADLRSTIAPHMLRREKKDVFGDDTATISNSATNNTAMKDNASVAAPAPPSITSSTAADKDTTAGASTSSNINGGAVPGSMPRKNDLVVWLRLKPNQRALYESFLNSDSVRQVLNRTKSALASLTVLKKICDHPALLSEKAAEGIISGAERAARKAQGLVDTSATKNKKKDWNIDDDEISSGSEDESEDDEELEEGEYRSPSQNNKNKPSTADAIDIASSDYDAWVGSGLETKLLDDLHKMGLEASCKTVFVLSLLRNLVAAGHRTLVFSQSRVMLNILEAAIRAEGWRICRIDGTVNAQERANRVNTFQTTSDIPIFLLTSQVGGLGLTLTAADRVIVVDPAWNPSVDSQSVDRAYRIGQKRDVVVYRLISCGTVEDKIYRKQVFKGGLSRTGMQDGEQFRYFSAAELRDMFRLDPVEAVESSTQKQLHALHAKQRQSTPELDDHLNFLTTLEGFSGISDHDLLYSVKEVEGNGLAPEMGSAAAGVPLPAEYQPGFSVPSPLKKNNRSGGGGGGGAGSQEWGGGGDISTMFGKMLSIGGSKARNEKRGPPSYEAATAAAAAAAAPSIQTGGRISPETSFSEYDIQQKQLESLKLQLAKQESLLSNPILVAGLMDGGAKIRARVEQLRQEILEMGGVLEEEESEKDVFVAAERQQEEVYAPAHFGTAAVPPPPPPPPARPVEESSAPSQQSLSPFQMVKSSFMGLFGNTSAPAVVPPPPPPPPPPLRQDKEESTVNAHLEHKQRQLSEETTTTNKNTVVKELKWQLYQRAKELAAAEANGNTSSAAALRCEVEELNAQYEAAKAAANTVVVL
jgi:SNF2 family DNA or RNA helicase